MCFCWIDDNVCSFAITSRATCSFSLDSSLPIGADLERWHQELFLATLAALIRPSFLTHPGFVMVSTRRTEEWNDENDRTEMGK